MPRTAPPADHFDLIATVPSLLEASAALADAHQQALDAGTAQQPVKQRLRAISQEIRHLQATKARMLTDQALEDTNVRLSLLADERVLLQQEFDDLQQRRTHLEHRALSLRELCCLEGTMDRHLAVRLEEAVLVKTDRYGQWIPEERKA